MKEYSLKINGRDYRVCIDSISPAGAGVTVNGTPYSVEFASGSQPAADGSPFRQVCPPSDGTSSTAAGLPAAVEGPENRGNGPSTAQAAPAAYPPSTEAARVKTVKSPLPGVIIGMKVGRGQTVRRGDKIAVLEAMKMENDILAPIDGTVTDIYVAKGDAVLEGAKIADIA